MNKFLWFIVLACFASTVTAADQNAARKVQTVGDYDALKAENLTLAEALKNAELRSKVAEKNAQMPTTYGSGANQVLMVSGVGKDLMARITLRNGGYVNARIGTNIDDVGTVTSISLDEVLVSGKKKTISLPFAGDGVVSPTVPAQNSVQNSAQSPNSVLPPLPQVLMPPAATQAGGR